MFREVLTLAMVAAILANQAMAVACHSHGETSESAARPHFHLGGHPHSHCHGHSHGHDHSHSHEHHGHEPGNLPEHDESATTPPSHDSDAVYLLDSEFIPAPVNESVSGLKLVADLASAFSRSHRTCDDAHFLGPAKKEPPLAHALFLKKVRLLL